MESVERVTQVWSTGSYAGHARNYLSMAAGLVEESGVDADDQVLDVACGTGIVAVTAARRGAQVTGLDITPAMLEDARANADLAGVEDVRWREGDATDLPFEGTPSTRRSRTSVTSSATRPRRPPANSPG
jgi:2-polyprenyl-3-methyl-5-hydroxy-6-metoxy-1,4-benzoquinol methylase